MSKVRPWIIFFVLSLLIILIWFKDGLYFGGAEVGLSPYYNPERFLSIQKFIWWGDIAPGVLVPQFINAVPFYFILSILQKLFSPLILQALLFFSLLFLMGYGMYLFAVCTLGNDKKNYAVIAGLFYMFNSYVMVEVWHRFLYTGIFLAVAIPFLALFWKKWISEGRPIFLIAFLLINFTFLYMYGNLTSFIAVWVLCLLITSAEIFLPWQSRRVALKASYKFLSGFILFIFTNLWWFIPVINVSTQILPQQHNIEDNVGTLVNISKQTILPFTLQYANPFYLFHTQELGRVYTSFIFLLLPWIPAIVILIGMLSSLKKRYLAALSIFYLISIVISKGAADPFGYPYIWGFMKTFFIGIIRNPFEKLGVLLPFFGSPLFVIGLENLFSFSQKKYGNFISKSLIGIIIGSVFIYAFPMFTGRVFNKEDHSLKVKVPKAYEDANDWFKTKNYQEGNILHLPFSGGDVATYKWENGYHGVEINEILFTSLPSITRNVGIKSIDNTLNSLTYIFVSPYSEDKDRILEILQNFNVKFIVLHKDIVWQDKNTYGEKGRFLNPIELEKVLNNLVFLKREQLFGDLVIYKLADESYKPILSISKNVQIIHPGQTEIMQILSFKDRGKDMITLVDDNNKDFLRKHSMIIFPDKRIEDLEASDSAIVSQINDIFTRQSSSPAIKQILDVRNYFSSVGYLQSSQLTEDLIISTQEILRLYGQALQNKIPPTSNQISNYESLIKRFIKNYSKNLGIHLFESSINSQLNLHIFILKQLGQEDLARLVRDFMVDKELLPIYRESGGIVFKFKIRRSGSYELLSQSPLNDTVITINGEKIASKDNIEIKEGEYEIKIGSANPDFATGTINDIAMSLITENEPLSGGEVLSIKKDSPVKYSGKIKIDGPSYILFSQSFHPGWVLTLTKAGTHSEIAQHLMGNLYGNAWWVNDTGVFDYQLEFTPQNYVTLGVVFSALSWAGLLALAGFTKFKKKS